MQILGHPVDAEELGFSKLCEKNLHFHHYHHYDWHVMAAWLGFNGTFNQNDLGITPT